MAERRPVQHVIADDLVARLHRIQDALAGEKRPEPADVEILVAAVPLLWADRRSPMSTDEPRPAPRTAAGLID